MKSGRFALLPLLWLTLTCACLSGRPGDDGPTGDPRAFAPDPDELLDAEALPGAFLWRQTVTASWGEGETRSFDAVVQRSGDALTVLGLSPTGSVGFSVVLRGGEVELTNRMPDSFPIDPRFILLDVQRAFYPWLAGSTPRADGTHEGTVRAEQVRERWSDGALEERVFERPADDGRPGGTVSIRYEWADGARAPVQTELVNDRFGYRLSIETYDERELAE